MLQFLGTRIAEILSDPVDIDYAENGTVIGYKVLSWDTSGTVASPIYSYIWKKGWNKAEMHRWERSGFYAYRSCRVAVRNTVASFHFVAKLEMAGKVIDCEEGYRSEYARIIEVMPSNFRIRRDLDGWMSQTLLLVEKCE